MATVQIYGVPPSTFTRTVRLACHEKGVDYELVPTMPSQVGPHNPFGKIPALRHEDFTLYESPAIVRYIDRTFPGAKLWPDEGRAGAICDQWVGAICDSLANSALRFMAARFGFLPAPDELVRKYLVRTRELIPIFDRQLGKQQFLAGGKMTAADLFLAPILFYFPELPELEEIASAAPNCLRWAREMGGRPSVKATDSHMANGRIDT